MLNTYATYIKEPLLTFYGLGGSYNIEDEWVLSFIRMRLGF